MSCHHFISFVIEPGNHFIHHHFAFLTRFYLLFKNIAACFVVCIHVYYHVVQFCHLIIINGRFARHKGQPFYFFSRIKKKHLQLLFVFFHTRFSGCAEMFACCNIVFATHFSFSKKKRCIHFCSVVIWLMAVIIIIAGSLFLQYFHAPASTVTYLPGFAVQGGFCIAFFIQHPYIVDGGKIKYPEIFKRFVKRGITLYAADKGRHIQLIVQHHFCKGNHLSAFHHSTVFWRLCISRGAYNCSKKNRHNFTAHTCKLLQLM